MSECLKSRVSRLEQRLRVESIVAELSNGDSFVLRRRDVLRICLDGFRMRYAELVGSPQPKSKFERELQLLQRVCTKTNEPLLAIISSVLYQDEGNDNEL